MNELELLERFNAYAQGDAIATGDARDRLINHVRESNHRARQLRAREAAGPKRRRRVRFGFAGAAAAVLAVAFLAVSLIGKDAATVGNSSLVLVADRVARQPAAAVLGKGQFFFSETKNFLAASFTSEAAGGKPDPKLKPWIQTELVAERTWISYDGSLTFTATPKVFPQKFPTAADRQAWIAAGRPGIVQGVNLPLVGSKPNSRPFTAGDKQLSYAQLNALPTDPAALRRRITELSAADTTTELMHTISALLEDPISIPLRSALYRVIADLPGVTEQSSVTDAIGRTGDALSWSDSVVRHQLVFDPANGRDLELRSYLLRPEAVDGGGPTAMKPGQLTERVTFVSRGIVDSPKTKIPAGGAAK